MGPRVSLTRLGCARRGCAGLCPRQGSGRLQASPALTPSPLLHQGPRGMQGPPGPPGKLGRRVSTGDSGFASAKCPGPLSRARVCPFPVPVPRGSELRAPSHSLDLSCRVVLERMVPGVSQGKPDPRSRAWGCITGSRVGGQDTQVLLWRGVTWTQPDACPTPQGDRGFDGLPGLPGEKGHRVSRTARVPSATTVPTPPHPLSCAG